MKTKKYKVTCEEQKEKKGPGLRFLTDSFKDLIRVATDWKRDGYTNIQTYTYNETTKQYERS